MRRITILFTALFCVQSISAQIFDTLFSSGFETEEMTEWGSTLENGLAVFERNTASNRTGNFGYHMQFSALDTKGNLVTPNEINWEAGVTYRISFWYKAVVPSDNSSTNVKLHLEDVTKIYQKNLTLNNTAWTRISFEYIPEVPSPNGYVLFSIRPNNSGGGEYYFDDFVIETVTPEPGFFTDLKTKDIESEASIPWTQFGPGMSGNNKCAFWHPTDPDVLYIGPNMGNSYITTDAGLTYQTVYNEDAPGIKSGLRGPREFMSLDFSRQDASFGFCTDQYRGGLYKTTDMGYSWTRPFDPSVFGDAYLGSVTVDPADDNIWYLGAGKLPDLGKILFTKEEPHGTWIDADSQGKIWKSIDGGQNWVLSNTGLHPKAEISHLAVDPVNSSMVFASTNYGFFRSSDAGATWELSISGLDNEVLRSFTMHHNNLNDSLTMYVINSVMWKEDGTSIADSLGGIFRSDDRGLSWRKVNGNLAIDMSQWTDNSVVKTSYYNPVAYYFGITTDEARIRFPDLPTSITQRFSHIEVDPNDPDNVYIVNKYSNSDRNNFKPGQMYRTENGGETWYVAFRNGKNWNSGPDIDYWTSRGNPLETNIEMQYMDHWVMRDDYDRKATNFTAFNADGSILHTQMAKISFMSYDKGDNWIDIDDVETTPGSDSWVGAGSSNVPGHGLYQHLSVPNKVFCPAGENSLWVTNDEGYKVREGAQAANSYRVLPDENSVSAVAIDPQDTMIWYALFFRQSKKGKLYRSTDGGVSWHERGTAIESWETAAYSGDQSVHQLHLIIDPVNTSNMYFCVPRSSRTTNWVGNSVTAFGVHKSLDGGKTWAEVNTGLPESLDVESICFDPSDPNTLYATVQSSGGGLYRSDDQGENWTEVTSATSIAGEYGINDIHFAANGKIYITSGWKTASADGGGLWVSEDDMQTWSRIFDHPYVFRVETANWDPNTIMISAQPVYSIDYRNPGTYLSKDGGETWIKFNKGNGQSDMINDIAIDNYKPGVYYCSTYGSGWYVARDQNPPVVTHADSVRLASDTLYLYTDDTAQVNAQIHPANASFTHLAWSSSDPGAVKVNALGMVTGIQAGEAVVTSKLVNSDRVDSIVVKVSNRPVDVTDVYFLVDSISLKLGRDTVLVVLIEPEDATNKELQWYSGDELIASVDTEGQILAKGIGETFIKVESAGFPLADTVLITVLDTTTIGLEDYLYTGFSIYPNPAGETLYIRHDPGIFENAKVRIYTSAGVQVLSKQFDDLASTARNVSCIDTAELQKGSYILKIQSDNACLQKVFLK